jgi:hypothetical protein
MDRMGGACNKYKEMRNAHKILIRNPEVQRTIQDKVVSGKIILK